MRCARRGPLKVRKRAALLCLSCMGGSFCMGAVEPEFHIPFEKYKLANGLRVILSRDTTMPVTAVYVLYDVGARTEEKGQAGFAHLVERMMFDGSANVKKGEHVRYVQANGGEAPISGAQFAKAKVTRQTEPYQALRTLHESFGLIFDMIVDLLKTHPNGYG